MNFFRSPPKPALAFLGQTHYNLDMTIDLLRGLLILYWLGMLAFGLDFLRRRRMPAAQYALWGLLALALPGLGPFLVIAIQPGQARRGRLGRNLRQHPNV